MPGTTATLEPRDAQAVAMLVQHVEYRLDRGIVHAATYLAAWRDSIVVSQQVARDRHVAGVDSLAERDRKLARDDAKLAELDRIAAERGVEVTS